MKAPARIAARLIALERELHDPDVRKSARVAELLADSFIEFGSSGRVLSREHIIANLRAETPAKGEARGFRVTLLAPNVALVTYRSLRKTQPPVRRLRSSIWRREGRTWKMVFHQGTPIPADA
jgi:hypothetical protein